MGAMGEDVMTHRASVMLESERKIVTTMAVDGRDRDHGGRIDCCCQAAIEAGRDDRGC